MELLVGIGKGKDQDPFKGGESAARDVASSLGNALPHALILFCAGHIDTQKFLLGVRSVFPETQLIGCTTAGHGTREELFDDGGVLMGIAGESQKNFVSTHATGVHNNETAIVKAVAENLRLQSPLAQLSGVLTFFDGLAGSGSLITETLKEEFPIHNILGGFAGDGMAFRGTQQFAGSEVFTDSAVALGISGVAVGVAAEHGWRTIGIPMTATKAEGALLMELDGKPAFSMYEKYFGDMAHEVREEAMSRLALMYPLGIVREKTVLVRAPLSVDEGGGILCGAEIPVGASVRLLLGSKDAMFAAASRAGSRAKHALGTKSPKAAIMVSSMARRKLLGKESQKEILAVSDALGSHVPLLCMYGYGEFAPMDETGVTFQNESLVVLAFG